MGHLLPVFLMMSIFGGTALILYIINSFILKGKILKAGKLDLAPEQIKALFEDITIRKSAPLKWGLILLFGGIGLIIIDVIEADPQYAMPWGIEIVSISLGFLCYHALSKDKEQKKEL